MALTRENIAGHTISFNGRIIKYTKKIESGMASEVFVLDDEMVVKKPRRLSADTRNLFNREVFWLKKLKNTGIVPQIIEVDQDQGMVLMQNCGEQISKDNLPNDWEEQIKNILDVFKQNNCQHNDLSEYELLVKDGKIRVIDFGVSSLGGDLTCAGRFADTSKKRLFDDKKIVNLVRFLYQKEKTGTELHCFVLWDKEYLGEVEGEILKDFEIIQSITYSPSSIKLLGKNRIEVLTRFYNGRISHHGEKGKKPFVVYVVLDEKPHYEMRINSFNGDTNIVNVNTFDLLQRIRKGRTSFLHGSDNIQESLENLKTLTFYDKKIPVCYWDVWRPKFDTFKEFFEALNSAQDFKYLVLRNYAHLLEHDVLESGNDLDLLVSDFFVFKRLTGAVSYKHKYSIFKEHAGPAVEYGGYKVAARVLIDGKEVPVDIRYVGDDYYDKKWECEMLDTRVKRNNFYTPSNKHLFYSLLYHALVHKRNFSDQYRERLTELAYDQNVIADKHISLDSARAWDILDQYMKSRGYAYVRPNELTIPFNARNRAGITIAEDLGSTRQRLKKGRLLPAKELLKHVLRDKPMNMQALWLLFIVCTRIIVRELHIFYIKLK